MKKINFAILRFTEVNLVYNKIFIKIILNFIEEFKSIFEMEIYTVTRDYYHKIETIP